MKAVKEIIDYIESKKFQWCKTDCGTGIYNTVYNIRINMVGNSAILSICNLYINDVQIPITYMDKFRLERAVNKWYKTINLTGLLTQEAKL